MVCPAVRTPKENIESNKFLLKNEIKFTPISNSILTTFAVYCFFVFSTIWFMYIFSVYYSSHDKTNFEVKQNFTLSDVGRGAVYNELIQCDKIPDEDRFDCFPREITNATLCLDRNCCWNPVSNKPNVPWCFYPKSYQSYKLVNTTKFKAGYTLLYDAVQNSSYPDNVQHLKMEVFYTNQHTLRIKIYDAENQRFEPPYPEVPIFGGRRTNDKDYYVSFSDKNAGFTISRNSTKEIIFNTTGVGGFTFADQFLQLSAVLPTKYIYGLGEQRNNFLLDVNWTQITLFNHANPPIDGLNLYGTHPFFLGFDKSGSCYGVFLLNSNAMDIILQPKPAITYRTIGGIFDFYFFFGPSPGDVVSQYLEIIGKPFLPPYWSLGFHLSRFGLYTLNQTVALWNRTREAMLPFDTMWNDIDYMENRNDFTLGDGYKNLPDFVNKLHQVGMRYVVILDPGVASREKPGTYPPYDIGLQKKIFVKDQFGLNPLEGRVWNLKGGTVFPDFTDPNVIDYWIKLMESVYNNITFDGLWLDMNEIENFVDGSLTGCGSNKWEQPPYVPGVAGNKLNYRTLCMSAVQHAGLHYNVHNLHAFAETMVTSFGLAEIRKKRPFILSRSTFSGFGHYAAHWTGDVYSTWDDMKHSVYDIMNFNLFGIPMIGADICGFNGNTTKELCQRWSQLGAFYPFSRNHNSDDCVDQDPVSLGTEVVESTKFALLNRYRLLPYLYSLFWKSHTAGETVVRPLFFEFPDDKNTYEINKQFLWGAALMITPVLDEGQTSVQVYFTNTTWFNFYTGATIRGKGNFVKVLAPLDRIPLFVRSGFIIPFQDPGLTTAESRNNLFGLLVTYNSTSQASGFLYWDDGESYNTWDELEYNFLTFKVENEQFSSTVVRYGCNETMTLGSVVVYGIGSLISSVTINGKIHPSFLYDRSSEMLNIFDMNVDLSNQFTILWM